MVNEYKKYEDDEIILLFNWTEDSSERDNYFKILYNRHKNYVYSICRDYCKSFIEGEEIANDLHQDIWVKVYGNLANYNNENESKNNALKWIAQIARNVLHDYLKQEQEVNVDEIDFRIPDNFWNSKSQFSNKEEKAIERALSEMEPDDRGLILTYYSFRKIENIQKSRLPKGMLKEIDEMFNTSDQYLKKKIRRLYKALETAAQEELKLIKMGNNG